jgi:hypothetical protein
MGYLGIMTLIANSYYKYNNGKLIFMVNPCHIYLLMCSIMMVTKRSKLTVFMWNYSLPIAFAPWTGTLFAALDGLDQPFEIELFFIEHLFCVGFLPLIFLL